VQAPDELTLVYNLNDRRELSGDNLELYEPERCHPIADGVEDKARTITVIRLVPDFCSEVMDRGRRMGLERNPITGQDKIYLDRIIVKPLPDAQSRFAACNRRGGYHLGRRGRLRQYSAGGKGPS